MMNIAWIKENVSAFLLFLILTLLVLFSLVDPNLEMPILGRKDKARTSFFDSHMIHLVDGEAQFEIYSSRADLFDAPKKIVFFDAIGSYFQNMEQILEIKAPLVEFDQDKMNMNLLKCSVWIKNIKEHAEVKSDYLLWDLKINKFVGYQQTTIESKSIFVAGNQITFEIPVKKFTVSGNSLVKIKHAI